MLKRIRLMIVSLALVALCGCFKIKDELIINADGSGTVRIESQLAMPPEMLDNLGLGVGMMAGTEASYPPLTEDQADKLFPEKDFTVKIKSDRTDGGELLVTVEASFKDLNALLASPYGRVHQLSLKLADHRLAFQALTGLEAAGRLSEMKTDDESGLGGMGGAIAQLQKKSDQMRVEFRVTLPNTLSSSNGARDGRTAAWIIERAKFKDADAFSQQLAVVCEAQCPADGFKASPATPQRLALRPFKELTEERTDTGTAVDTKAVQSAAKFVPYGLQVTRSLDLSGEGGSRENGALLLGAVVVPKQFSPQKWGEPKLDEVVDAKGHNLVFDESMEGRMSSMQVRWGSRMDDPSDDAADGEKKSPTEERHPVTIGFRPPEWKVNEIARIKGSLDLFYFSGSQLLKLTNIIASAWIHDESKGRAGMFNDEDGAKLQDPALTRLGMTLSLEAAMRESGATMLMLQVGDKQAELLDAQVFYAEGRPWPTFVQKETGMSFGEDHEGNTSVGVIVAGKPAAPLSLALLASGNATAVSVPIALEHVQVTPQAK